MQRGHDGAFLLPRRPETIVELLAREEMMRSVRPALIRNEAVELGLMIVIEEERNAHRFFGSSSSEIFDRERAKRSRDRNLRSALYSAG